MAEPGGERRPGTWRNWGRTVACRPARILAPGSEDEVAAALAAAREGGALVRVAGAGHSFTPLVATDGWLLRLDRLERVLAVDESARTVEVEAGITLGRLNAELSARGLALSNLGDIAYQSVAGAIATGTHGTGAAFGNISSLVAGMRLVLADGTAIDCSPAREPEIFAAARVHLGALGVVTRVTLRVEPAFNLHAVERPRRLEETLEALDDLVDANEHFELFWFPHTDRVLTKANNRSSAPAAPRGRVREWLEDIVVENKVFGAVCALGRLYPVLIPTLNRVVGRVLSETDRVDRSDRVFASPRLVRFQEMEYGIPRAAAADAVREVRAAIERERVPVAFPVEVRFVAPDDIWLSPSFERETCYVAVHVYRGLERERYFGVVESIMRALGGRPHWGKMHTGDATSLRPRYPRWDDFGSLRARLDPEGRFRNAETDRILGPVGRGPVGEDART